MKPKSLPISCSTCQLYTLGSGFTDVEGSGLIPLLIIAEASGENESRDSLPLRPYAQSGSIFTRALRELGYTRDQFSITNLLRCRPPNNFLQGAYYEEDAIRSCSQYLDPLIERLKPKAILALGSLPLKYLSQMSGDRRSISDLRGYVLPSKYNIPLVSTFHPAFLARGETKYSDVFKYDIQRAIQLAQGQLVENVHYQLRPQDNGRYTCHPSIEQVALFLQEVQNDVSQVISYDIETESSGGTDEEALLPERARITLVQFSLRREYAIAIPFTVPYIPYIKAILESSNPKVGQNVWLFDNPTLRHNGIEVKGICDDIRWMFQSLQPDLPANLQWIASFYNFPFPWKHLAGSSLEWYGCADVDSVQYIYEPLKRDLEKRGLWNGYIRHKRDFFPLLERMSDRGLPLNTDKLATLRETLVAEGERIDVEIQRLVPDELKEYHPRLGYKVLPSAYRNRSDEELVGMGLVKRTFEKAAGSPDLVERWCRPLPFLVSSSKQVLGYLKYKRYKIPLKIGTKDQTTEKKQLERLALSTKDELLTLALEHRAISKVVTGYIDSWKPDTDGKVHAKFTFKSTGQLAAVEPAILTAPKGKYGKQFMQCFEAPEGHIFVSLDWRAFHARTLGFLAGDEGYYRLADLDIHSYVAGHMLSLPQKDKWLQRSDTELRSILGDIKREHEVLRNKQAKPAILGIGFGLQANKLYELNREHFKTKREADKLISLIKSLFPAMSEFQESVKHLAHRQRYLISPYGHIRRFLSVYRYSPGADCSYCHSQHIGGIDAESAIAFLPANVAFSEAKEKMLEMDERGYLERWSLLNYIHDALVFCPLESEWKECAESIISIMQSPSKVLISETLGEFTCAAEPSIGYTLGDLKEVKL